LTLIGVVKMIDNHLYISTTRLSKKKSKVMNKSYTPL